MIACCLLFSDGLHAKDVKSRLKLNVETHRVFGSEHPGLYKHPASITELSNGDLYISYYGGSGEYNNDTAVYGSRRKSGEATWSMPAVIADTPVSYTHLTLPTICSV